MLVLPRLKFWSHKIFCFLPASKNLFSKWRLVIWNYYLLKLWFISRDSFRLFCPDVLSNFGMNNTFYFGWKQKHQQTETSHHFSHYHFWRLRLARCTTIIWICFETWKQIAQTFTTDTNEHNSKWMTRKSFLDV